ncbi:MAG: hypothetical protein IJA85_07395 [Clostridia bacterium]|nr:hypothetical protein [Clostridia bacterium]
MFSISKAPKHFIAVLFMLLALFLLVLPAMAAENDTGMGNAGEQNGAVNGGSVTDQTGSGAGNGVGNGGNTVSDAVSDAGNMVSDAVSDVGDAVTDNNGGINVWGIVIAIIVIVIVVGIVMMFFKR